MKPHAPSPAHRFGEWACDLAVAALVWWMFSPIDAAVYLALTLLWSVRRHHFLDLGRFTVGVVVGPRVNVLFGVALTRYGDQGRVSGFEVMLLRHSLLVCALAPRDEWKAFQRRNAERRAALEKGGAE